MSPSCSAVHARCKSRHAEALARATGFERIYIATAEAFDAEMTERIAHHRSQRAGDGWTTVEAPLDCPGNSRQQAGPDRVVLVDCLTLWLSNLMLGDHPLAPAEAALIAALEAADGPVILFRMKSALGLCQKHHWAARSGMRKAASTSALPPLRIACSSSQRACR